MTDLTPEALARLDSLAASFRALEAVAAHAGSVRSLIAALSDAVDDREELEEEHRARVAAEARLAAVRALCDDMEQQPPTELAPVPGVALLIRRAIEVPA